jgi:hypothetical protein
MGFYIVPWLNPWLNPNLRCAIITRTFKTPQQHHTIKKQEEIWISIYNGIESGKEEEWCSLFQP